jgi:hypothetical protein
MPVFSGLFAKEKSGGWGNLSATWVRQRKCNRHGECTAPGKGIKVKLSRIYQMPAGISNTPKSWV